MKFCVNCANFKLSDKLENRPDLGVCTRVDAARDPVTGDWEDGRRWQWAKVVRGGFSNDSCGPGGKYWVAKEGFTDV